MNNNVNNEHTSTKNINTNNSRNSNTNSFCARKTTTKYSVDDNSGYNNNFLYEFF
jgi:hypothetical protein